MDYLLALDEGTSSARAVVFNRLGETVGLGRSQFAQHYPQPGWVEHDANEIWAAQLAAAQQAIAQASIGITNQRETTLVWDRKTGEPIANAIVWQDRRTAHICKQLADEGNEPMVREKTGLLLDPYFSATKLRWLLEHIPAAANLAEQGRLAFGTIDTWLLWKLSGGAVHATDASNASRTLLYNIHSGSWDEDLLALFGVPRSVLPEVLPSAHPFGSTGLFGGQVAIGGIAGDQQAATFGQLCFGQGMVKNTYGTGCFMLMNTGNQPIASQNRLITTVAWKLGNETTYALEGAIFSAGASIGWLVETGILASAEEAESLAESLADNGGVYFVPAFAGLGAPQWDPFARGTLLGLTRGSTRAHLARAALEAMAFQSDEVLQAMARDSQLAIPTLRVDGGASQSNLLMQLQADLSGVRVERPTNIETTALGAALLAGLQAGVYDSLAHLEALHNTNRVFNPTWTAPQRAQLRSRWQQAVARSAGWETSI
jgi:glycerol kinase